MISKILSVFGKSDNNDTSYSDNVSNTKISIPFSLDVAKRRYEEEMCAEYHIKKYKSFDYQKLFDNEDFFS